MWLAKNTCIIGRDDNVVLVDFTRKPDPPAPRFPGANAVRAFGSEDIEMEWRAVTRPSGGSNPGSRAQVPC